MHPDDCRHRMRVGLGGQRYLCLSCGERWKQAYRGKAPQVPPGWEEKPLEELRLWYARAILKARI